MYNLHMRPRFTDTLYRPPPPTPHARTSVQRLLVIQRRALTGHHTTSVLRIAKHQYYHQRLLATICKYGVRY